MTTRTLRSANRACRLALAAAALALGATSCGASTTGRAQTFAGMATATRSSAPRLGAGVLVAVSGAAAGPVGSDPRHLVWESGPIETDSTQPVLHDRVLSTGATRVIARRVDPLFGVASTARRVFFARTAGGRTQLLEVSHRGGDPRVLSDSLAAPIASRGGVVAWAEQSDSSLRVVALDTRGGARWTVATLPRCGAEGCYRIGAVTVADAGVVFTRDAVGPQASEVVRRAFTDPKPSSIAIANDPQPDLVPSSTGALYYALARGWYRWDFGERDPRAVRFEGSPTTRLLRYESGRWYWLVRDGCSYRVDAGRDGGNASRPVVAPRLLRTLARAAGACQQLTGLAWTGRQPITAWALAAAASEASHEDEELRGAVVAGRATSP